MIINKMAINLDYCPKYNEIEKFFIDILEIDINYLSIECTIIDDWCFTNEKEVSKVE